MGLSTIIFPSRFSSSHDFDQQLLISLVIISVFFFHKGMFVFLKLFILLCMF